MLKSCIIFNILFSKMKTTIKIINLLISLYLLLNTSSSNVMTSAQITSCYFGTSKVKRIQECEYMLKSTGPFLYCAVKFFFFFYSKYYLHIYYILLNYIKKVIFLNSQSSSYYSCLSEDLSIGCGLSATSNGTTTIILCCNTNNCNSAQFLQSNIFILSYIILFQVLPNTFTY